MSISMSLFLSFIKIGSLTFGGGYAMVPVIQNEIVDRKMWIRKKDFLELLTLAQSAPGPIALNTAVFVGFKVDRYRGAICSILGIIIPSFFVILLIAMFFSDMQNYPAVEAVFKGVRPAVVALIVAPVITLSKGLDVIQILSAIVAVAVVWYFGFSPIYLLIVGAAAGLIYTFYRKKVRK